jgi:hypothetical protein
MPTSPFASLAQEPPPPVDINDGTLDASADVVEDMQLRLARMTRALRDREREKRALEVELLDARRRDEELVAQVAALAFAR